MPAPIPGTLAAGWEDFRRRVLPADAGAVQISEMRKAFYAGAAVMYDQMVLGPVAMSDEQTERHLQALHEELQEFAAEMLRAAKGAGNAGTH